VLLLKIRLQSTDLGTFTSSNDLLDVVLYLLHVVLLDVLSIFFDYLTPNVQSPEFVFDGFPLSRPVLGVLRLLRRACKLMPEEHLLENTHQY